MYYKENELKLVALGGADEIGASCYFLQIGRSNILLDCGLKAENCYPNFAPLIKKGLIEQNSQINQVFISHAHLDHIGYLPQIFTLSNAAVYCTYLTKEIGYHLLWDLRLEHVKHLNKRKQAEDELLVKECFDRIKVINYMKEISFPDYKITFYESGHISGAAMMHIKTKNRSLLYTGDFSGNFFLPENLCVDTMIICGTYANNPTHVSRDRKNKIISEIVWNLKKNRSVYLQANQLTKGIELLALINEELPKVNVYLEQNIMWLAQKMSELRVLKLGLNNFTYNKYDIKTPCVYIGKDEWQNGFVKIKSTFSLHADYNEIKAFIKKLNPDKAVIVHVGACDLEENREILSKELMLDAECKTRLIYPKNGDVLIL